MNIIYNDRVIKGYTDTHPRFIELYNKYFYLFEVERNDYKNEIEQYEIKLNDDFKTVLLKRIAIFKIAKNNLDVVDRELDLKRDLKYNEFKKEFDLMLYKS